VKRIIILFGITTLTGFVLPVGGQESAPALRVASYNIRHGEGVDRKIDLKRIAGVINALQPDLVALQEVDKTCSRSGNQDLAAELGRLTGMHHRFGKFMDFQGGEYGMAILSRLPIVKAVRHPLPAGAEPRCALEVKVRAPAITVPLSFVCIHNDWTDERIRVNQVQALLAALGGHANPIILAGDFNGERSDASMALLEQAGWRILEKNKGEQDKTFPSGDPGVEIDFVVLKRLPVAAVEHQVIHETVASDHRPILAVMTFPGTETRAGQDPARADRH
jgi:endonuclease/exonuclease/phosphatase family metal-dependent hydrolase